jgi:hypothetical protein
MRGSGVQAAWQYLPAVSAESAGSQSANLAEQTQFSPPTSAREKLLEQTQFSPPTNAREN